MSALILKFTKNLKFIISYVAESLLVMLCLSGCISSSYIPAPVSSVKVNSNMNISNNRLTTSLPKMSRITNSKQITTIQSLQRSVANIKNIKSAGKQVQTQNGHIVYNRQYGIIPKGSYTGGSTYTVKRGDTLYYIAWITGNDFHNLAQRNNVLAPYNLEVGQKLQVGKATNKTLMPGNTILASDIPAQSHGIIPMQKSTTVVVSRPIITYSKASNKEIAGKMLLNNKNLSITTESVKPSMVNSNKLNSYSNISTRTLSSNWRWPTEGKIIEKFSSSEWGNKGIDIAGSKGQAIVATADGRVVYAGNALRGYGNLIIIKHSDDYLSAYAHNDKMLVHEQQEVKARQKIATMGSTGTSSTRLHFEIRRKGKSVNPLQYLPKR